MCDRISKTIVAGATALSLAAAALATAEPAAAQWRSWNHGGQSTPGYMASGAPWGPPEAARGSAPYSWSGFELLLAGSPNLFHLRSLARQPAGQRLLIVASRGFFDALAELRLDPARRFKS